MKENPHISIIIPVYKAEKYLRDCLDSIAAQTFAGWECILIDDGSPDSSGMICEEYAARDSRFIAVHQKNGGASAARNAGLAIARGDWIGFVDADDWIDSDSLEMILEKAKRQGSELIQFGLDYDLNGKAQYQNIYKEGYFSIKDDFSYWSPSMCNKLIASNLVKTYNICYPEGVKFAEDTYFSFMCYFYAKNACAMHETFYHYRINDSSATRNFLDSYIDDDINILTSIEQFLIDKNAVNDYKTFLDEKKFLTKKNVLYLSNKIDFRKVRSVFPEVNNRCPRFSMKNKIVFLLLFLHLDFLLYIAIKIKRKI